ncbi:PREDICTED: HEAT repeat-containing protein 3 isoform X2 [Polistes dominula]|uniref:HEAT repeat-containing protein 3 isoform X2 n=1 Tax=Polistes dominula TaxID=743375 RepID=A0ABM1IBL3_POLDO|nr:PREDICTED: HEAT repeat-containing protein 3 isoform X2 [Polistes dominula]
MGKNKRKRNKSYTENTAKLVSKNYFDKSVNCTKNNEEEGMVYDEMGKNKRKRIKSYTENPTGLVSDNHFDESEDCIKDSKKEDLLMVYNEMVKNKLKRNKPHTENPTGLVSNNHFDESEDCINENKEEKLRLVYDEIQSLAIEEKLSGLRTLESMSFDEGMAERIASDGIAKMIGPLLVDHNIIVRAAVVSALRHIAENGKEGTITKFINDDIMTPLSTLFVKDYRKWQPKLDPIVAENICDEKETFIDAVTLLLILCENNEMAVKHSNKLCLLSILLQYLNVTACGIEISTVIAQCILTLSEDNSIAIEILKEYKQDLLNILNLQVSDNLPFYDLILLKTLIIGILLNMHCFTKNNEIDIFNEVMKILLETLAIDNNSLSHDLCTILSTENGILSKETLKKIQEFKKLLVAQQQTLEILTNLCTDEEENELLSDLDDSDEMNEEEPMDKDEPNETDLSGIISSLPVEIIEIITNFNIIKKVWIKTVNIDNEIRECFSKSIEGKALLKQICVLRCRAYSCAHNLLFITDINSANDMKDLYDIWCQTGKFVFEDKSEYDFELLDSATAVLRACLQKLAKAQENYFSNLTVKDINPMLYCDRLFLNKNVGANVIRIFKHLALLIAQTDTQHKYELMKYMSVFILLTCRDESCAWIKAECLDAVMDIFSDDETDQLAVELSLTSTLPSLVQDFKERVGIIYIII